MARNRKIMLAFRLIAALSICIASVRVRTLSGVFKLVSVELEPAVVTARKVCPDLTRKGNTSQSLDRYHATPVNSEILLGKAATLTACVLRDDTSATWSKRPNEEADPKESLSEEDSTSTIREACECQAP